MTIQSKIAYPGRVDLPPTEAKIFLRMWSELAQLGQLPAEYGVLCPLCLRPKSHEELTLEHIIPQRALRHDSESLRRQHPLNNRSGLTLLCSECNGLKGSKYDPLIERMFRYPKPQLKHDRQNLNLKAIRTLAYLAAFRELGYFYVLSSSLEAVRFDFLHPNIRSDTTGPNFVTTMFERLFPHAYFDGWCDTFDIAGSRVNSVFSICADPMCDTIQVRMRHITVTLPAGNRRIIVHRPLGSSPRFGLDFSQT